MAEFIKEYYQFIKDGNGSHRKKAPVLAQRAKTWQVTCQTAAWQPLLVAFFSFIETCPAWVFQH